MVKLDATEREKLAPNDHHCIKTSFGSHNNSARRTTKAASGPGKAITTVQNDLRCSSIRWHDFFVGLNYIITDDIF